MKTSHGWAQALLLALVAGAASAAEPGVSKCAALEIAAAHPLPGVETNPFLTTQRLVRIDDGTVPCLHADSLETARCTFSMASDEVSPESDDASIRLARTTGHWVQDLAGQRYALVGQPLTRDGARNGPYVIAAHVRNNTVPCVQGARSRDMAGVSASQELVEVCAVETMLSSTNALRRPLENYATIPVCTSTYPHPDGARLVSADRAAGVYCYKGQGAGLNDRNGRERDQRGNYLMGRGYCHVGWSGGVEVYVSKRPVTVKYPSPGRVDPRSPLVWRPVSSVRVAN